MVEVHKKISECGVHANPHTPRGGINRGPHNGVAETAFAGVLVGIFKTHTL